MRTEIHTHTSASDGADRPADLVNGASAVGVEWLAVTDHDTMSGLAEAALEADRLGVEFLTGIELSLTVRGTAVHVLGYGFDPGDEALRDYVGGFDEARRVRAAGMLRRLKSLGVPPLNIPRIDDDEPVGRPHIAAALVEAGVVDSHASAFRTYLAEGRPAYIPMPARPAAEAIRLLHDAGGIAVLAHPGHWTAHDVIERLVRVGLDGIEVWHPMHDDGLTDYYGQLAERTGLLATGGSDYHGRGDALGQWSLPEHACRRLRERLSLSTSPASGV